MRDQYCTFMYFSVQTFFFNFCYFIEQKQTGGMLKMCVSSFCCMSLKIVKYLCKVEIKSWEFYVHQIKTQIQNNVWKVSIKSKPTHKVACILSVYSYTVYHCKYPHQADNHRSYCTKKSMQRLKIGHNTLQIKHKC